MLYKSKDFKVGLKVEINDVPYIILENNFVNPGKGQAFNKLKLKNMINDAVIPKTVKIGERLKAADVSSKEAKFLYSNNDGFCFIDIDSSEYYEVSPDFIQPYKGWIKEDVVYTILFWNGDIISFKIPKFIELKVISTEDVAKTSTVSKSFKNAILETNVTFKVPLFIKENDIIKIDTEKEEYVSRIL